MNGIEAPTGTKRGLTLRFIDEIQYVCLICSLQCAYIIIFCTLENLGQTCKVHTERHGAITAIALEGRRSELDGNEGNVRVVHGLKHDSFFVTFEISIGDELFDCCEPGQ